MMNPIDAAFIILKDDKQKCAYCGKPIPKGEGFQHPKYVRDTLLCSDCYDRVTDPQEAAETYHPDLGISGDEPREKFY